MAEAPFVLLVGLPGSGKSTWAAEYIRLHPGYRVVSTDAIRAELFGDEANQGDWLRIWEVIQERWRAGRQAIAAGELEGLIYDATNTRRRQRRIVVAAVRALGFGPILLCWFDVPLEHCLQRNQQRSRQVPPEVIMGMDRQLKGAPPTLEEGVDRVQRLIPEA